MDPAKKKSVLLSFFGAPKDGEEPDGDEGAGAKDDGDADFDQACDEAMSALKSGDKVAFCDALKAAIDMRIAGGVPKDEADGEEG